MTWMVSIWTYPRWPTAPATACGPAPNGSLVSSRWARSQIRRASVLVRGRGSVARGIARQCNRIRRCDEPGFGDTAPLRTGVAPPLLPITHAAGGDLGLAGGAAGLGRLTFVDVAGEAIDEPRALLRRAFEPDVAAAERIDQRRQQNCSGDHRRADQCWHGIPGTSRLRCAGAIALILTLPLD